MRCPKCSSDNTRVIDSRDTSNGKEIRRRRTCEACEHRFTTFEKYAAPKIMVEKKGGFLEPYHREKVERGIWRALEKRNINPDLIRLKIDQLEEKWAKKNNQVLSTQIGQDIMTMLLKEDEVAYIRFASVYKDFKNIQEFESEIKNFINL